MKKIINIYLPVLIAFVFAACEDVVNVKLEQGPKQLVVDGWITDRIIPDTITLSTTAAYFENQSTPKVSGAKVVLSNNEGVTEKLTEVKPGKYLVQTIKSKVGGKYTLTIEFEGENYEAKTEAMRSGLRLDSLTYEFKKKSAFIEEEGYVVKMSGQELEGKGDSYRFKIMKNGVYLKQDLRYWNDDYVDGKYLKDVEFRDQKPFALGDKVSVETYSITKDAYHFFDEMDKQIHNGGLFANPPANVRTNIKNVNPNSSKKAVGYFGASLVTTIEGVVK
ncbi:DUF4249 domain-containing protein [Solitalea koreensis]|uniref:DUF4249 domain-containing protein n=1 Tax=Solitalea koreensis TaxID=543615 RepID=A0A521BCN0_9SPHI|nr:DUF4249 domain-containing protein [Solitalea koreensis]SMO44838.1 protein of unknown function [Solitalea koreensis]